tara:strand:+ start:117 stop:434 length:318 start_codon:yes stop_codon:yes gene_type:complete
LDVGERFKVKRLTINPGHSTSLQYHNHRSERWVVVRGEATVTRGNETYCVKENDWIYIPVKKKHMLANEAKTVMELIEVQVGDYLGEDDIVRIEDKYGRINDFQK